MTSSGFRLFFSILLPFILLACFEIDSGSAQVEVNPTPRKFDEFALDYYKANSGSELDVEARLLRFARQLRREPRTKAYVIAYSPRVRNRRGSDYWSIAENRLLTTKAQLSHKYGVRENRIIGVDGGIRENTTVELWILPAGAKPPAPRPEFKGADVIECCVIHVSGEIYQYAKDQPLTFKASSSLGTCPQITAFRWTTSSGRVISGQGTDTIKVDVARVSAHFVSVTVEAEGMAPDCINRASVVTVIGVVPYKLAEFEWFSEDLKVWGDYLSYYLHKEPHLRGHIIVYAGRDGDIKHAQARAEYARDYLVNLRALSPDRFSIGEGGYREKEMFEYWLVPVGMSPPDASPSVDKKYVRLRSGSKTLRRRR